MIGLCNGNCTGNIGPPPDYILSMPPPPLPSFLLPKNTLAAIVAPNDSQPCYATFMCEPNQYPRENGGMEFIELVGANGHSFDNTWLLVLVASCVVVLLLGGILAFVLMKCKDAVFSTCNLTYHDSNIKQNSINTLGDNTKNNPFMTGGILYPCSANNRDSIQNHLTNDSRLLWATLTPHGTRHFIADNPIQDGHYEVVDYRSKPIASTAVKRAPVRSFDNNGFIDYDYEDPTPLMESYHDDMDSGYQEPHEVFATMHRSSPRPIVSSPTRIDHPNIAPLNFYPSHRSIHNNINNTLQYSTMTRKASLNRRISDASSYNGANK